MHRLVNLLINRQEQFSPRKFDRGRREIERWNKKVEENGDKRNEDSLFTTSRSSHFPFFPSNRGLEKVFDSRLTSGDRDRGAGARNSFQPSFATLVEQSYYNRYPVESI